LAISEIIYLTYEDVVFLHFDQMRRVREIRIGVYDRDLIRSALARPRHSARYENADIVRQAATLYFGFIKNHPWLGGNKRTATAIVEAFLMLNGFEVVAKTREIVELVLAIESDHYSVDEIEDWLRTRIVKFTE
jgi:death-on-curing protein